MSANLTYSLVGKREIARYTRRSWTLITKWIATKGFPATKLDGIWESSQDLIDAWKREQILIARPPEAGAPRQQGLLL